MNIGGTYKGITRHSNIGQLAEPFLPLLRCEGSREILENGLKRIPFRARLGELAADEEIDRVALVGSLRALLPLDS